MNKILKNIFGVFHWLALFSFSFYGFVISKNGFDKIYILITIIWLISLNLLMGECFWSYFIKKFSDMNYKMGSKINDLDDMTFDNSFLKNALDKYGSIIFMVLFIIYSVSIFLVLRRNEYSLIFSLLLPVLLIGDINFLRMPPNDSLSYKAIKYSFLVLLIIDGITVMRN